MHFLVQQMLPILENEIHRHVFHFEQMEAPQPIQLVFTTESDLHLSDPSFVTQQDIVDDFSCALSIPNTRLGEWVVTLPIEDCGVWGERVSSLIAKHTDYRDEKIPENSWEKHGILGVDTGQVGLFDSQRVYQMDKDDVYDLCCDRSDFSLADNVTDIGIVTNSGLGDGFYNVFVYKQDGMVVCVRVDFLTDEQLEMAYSKLTEEALQEARQESREQKE